MKIGIIGSGNMGRALGSGWAAAGHDIFYGSRDLAKASGSFDEAAAFGDVILYTVRGRYPSALLESPQNLAGKIIIDCNNRDVGDDANPGQFRITPPPPGPTLTELLAADTRSARVVKAFSTVPQPVIALGRSALEPHHVSVYICGQDEAAKKVVSGLAADLGFVGVDSGGLDQSWMIDALADFLRFQIGPMKRGFYATISIKAVSDGGRE